MTAAIAALVFAAASASAPPQERAALVCFCEEKVAAGNVRATAIDAEMRFDATGLNPLLVQTTIFRVLKAAGVKAATPLRVRHTTDPLKCGVTFDYGRLYDVGLRVAADGAFETDACLVKPVSSAP